MLEPVLGYKSAWRLLSLFAETPRKELDTSRIRQETGIGNQSLENGLRRLVAAHLLLERRGKPSRYLLNLEHPTTKHLLVLLDEERRSLRQLDYPVRVALAELLRQIAEHPGFMRALLFGSHAKGYARPESDIDVALVFSEKPDELWVAAVQKDVKMQIHVFSGEEFEEGSSLAKQIRSEGIDLFP